MKHLLLPLLSVVLTANFAAAQSPGSTRIQGDVTGLAGNNLSIKSLAGEMLTLKLADPVRILTASQTDLTAIHPNAYVAVTAVPQTDGSLLASRINIFPESMRGVGEGHRPMAALPGNTMTNATVSNVAAADRPAGNTMTNATVTRIAGPSQAGKLRVHYPGGEKQVAVPPGLSVTLLEAGDRAMLVPGAHVTVTATRADDGTMTAASITAGKNGAVPPP